MWLEKGLCSGRQHSSRTNILLWLLQINTSTGTAQVQEWDREVGMDCRGGSRPPKSPKALWLSSRKVWKNELCVIPDLHRKWENWLQGGENLSIKRYPHQAWVIPPEHPISWTNTGTRIGDLFSLSLPLFLFNKYVLLSLPFLFYLFIHNPLSCAYIVGQELTYQFPCQVHTLIIKLCEFCGPSDFSHSFWPLAFVNLGCFLPPNGRMSL